MPSFICQTAIDQSPFSQKEFQITYRFKDNRQEKDFDALDWLAAMGSHIPIQRESCHRWDSDITSSVVTPPEGFVKRKIWMPFFPCVIEAVENTNPNRNWVHLINNGSAYFYAHFDQ